MKVKLEWFEAVAAADVGTRRELNSRSRKLKDTLRYNPNASWGSNVESASAEMAVAKYLGVYWDGSVNVGRRADIGKNIEVRWNQSPERKSAKVKPHDEGIIVAVSGNSPDFTILGWIKADDGKRKKWLARDLPLCYFVPLEELSSIDKLKV